MDQTLYVSGHPAVGVAQQGGFPKSKRILIYKCIKNDIKKIAF
jgi:hypothetical protein